MPFLEEETSVALERRFGWINAFMTASLNALLVNSNMSVSSTLGFQDVNRRYIDKVLQHTANVTRFPEAHFERREVDYLFHLESELWGSDCERYLRFYEPTKKKGYCVLQTFLLPQAFILLERWLHGFLTLKRRIHRGRPAKRRLLFGKDQGIFTVKHKECLAALGAPYCLLATRAQVRGSSEWMRLKASEIPSELLNFYRASTGCDHFCRIIESSFKGCRRKLPRRIFPPPKAIRHTETRGLKATWYDIMWGYSESVRYHPLCPSDTLLDKPYFWNRSVRWCTSIMISGLMCLIRKRSPKRMLTDAWLASLKKNQVLKTTFGASRDPIFN